MDVLNQKHQIQMSGSGISHKFQFVSNPVFLMVRKLTLIFQIDQPFSLIVNIQKEFLRKILIEGISLALGVGYIILCNGQKCFHRIKIGDILLKYLASLPDDAPVGEIKIYCGISIIRKRKEIFQLLLIVLLDFDLPGNIS